MPSTPAPSGSPNWSATSGGIRSGPRLRVARQQPQPGLVLARAHYEAATREDELTRRVDPVHPLFYPAAFDALGA